MQKEIRKGTGGSSRQGSYLGSGKVRAATPGVRLSVAASVAIMSDGRGRGLELRKLGLKPQEPKLDFWWGSLTGARTLKFEALKLHLGVIPASKLRFGEEGMLTSCIVSLPFCAE